MPSVWLQVENQGAMREARNTTTHLERQLELLQVQLADAERARDDTLLRLQAMQQVGWPAESGFYEGQDSQSCLRLVHADSHQMSATNLSAGST